MKRFIVGTIINALGLWLTCLVIPAIQLHPYGGSDIWPTMGSYLLVALVFGLVMAIVAPVVKVLAFPIYVLTFGLISFLINGALLIFVAWLSGFFGSGGGLSIDGFDASGLSWPGIGWAMLGAIVMSVASFFARWVFKVARIL